MDGKGGKRAEEGGARDGNSPGGLKDQGTKASASSTSVIKPTGGDEVMKAPGAEGFISREAFEKNPQGYFHGLHHVKIEKVTHSVPATAVLIWLLSSWNVLASPKSAIFDKKDLQPCR
ncbi:hypothetical protein ZIOFF_062626 [Zingiber officinale]|uniref:Uncharacterized protein n=1 Tax=Zingiber officinale TaxID=94328 RepID=A0A8J5F0M7_ZINOF|nr:hypothetical protein ZIOFF_062626 [Zingiber officinale]